MRWVHGSTFSRFLRLLFSRTSRKLLCLRPRECGWACLLKKKKKRAPQLLLRLQISPRCSQTDEEKMALELFCCICCCRYSNESLGEALECAQQRQRRQQKRELLLTLHSAQSERFDAVEFHIRGQVEVLSGILVDLKEKCAESKDCERCFMK